MKADLVEYICALSDNQDEVFEDILIKKYKKFVNFFELVRDYGDDIVRLKYNLSDENTLDVTITMRTNVKHDIKEEMKSELESMGYNISTKIAKRKLSITIIYDEHR